MSLLCCQTLVMLWPANRCQSFLTLSSRLWLNRWSPAAVKLAFCFHDYCRLLHSFQTPSTISFTLYVCVTVLILFLVLVSCSRNFPSVLWHCWLGDRKGIRPVKKLDVGLLVVMIWLKLCTTYSSSTPDVTTTSIILCFNKHQLTQVHLENGC